MTADLWIPMAGLLASAGPEAGGADFIVRMQRFVLEMAAILIAARAGSLVFQRMLRLPAVIGELLAGVLIGPFALGAMPIPGLGPLFPRVVGIPVPVSPEMYAVATMASLVLLFQSGLETDLGVFLRYFSAGTAVGIGGVVVSFAVGAGFACWAGLAPNWLSPPALFAGAVTTATSVGITARILSELKRTGSPEGVTILAAAVLDDVLGIIVLAIVMAMAKVGGSGVLAWSGLGWLMVKTFGIWLACTATGILSARHLSALMKRIGPPEVITAFAFGLALLLAGLMEMAGLAMIIGAYIMGLSLSRTDLALEIRRHLHGVHDLLVPVFFCVMGMLIDLHALWSVWRAGLVFSVLAVLAKVVGCGGPALGFGFNLRGALRIGLGMVPRGEVALIIAGAAVATRSAGPEVFGLAVLMTVITTLVAPPLLVASFRGGPGLNVAHREGQETVELEVQLCLPELASFLFQRMADSLRSEEFFVTPVSEDPPVYQVRKDAMVFTLRQEDRSVVLSTPARHADIGRLLFLEELVQLQSMMDSLRQIQGTRHLCEPLVRSLFQQP